MAGTTRGALIVIEGLDRAGKSTQCERLCLRLEQEGHQVRRMRFPDRTTPVGASINTYLRGTTALDDHAIHLLFSANRWEAASQIRADIAAGVSVVVDRYFYSGIVYSAAKGIPGLTAEWSRQPEVGLPRPDVCVFLDVEPGVVGGREGFGGERYEEGAMQGRVREGFLGLLGGGDGADMRVVDAGRGVKEVERGVWEVVEGVVRERGSMGPLRSVLPLDQSCRKECKE